MSKVGKTHRSPTLCYAQGMLSPHSGLLAALGWAAHLHKDGHDDASSVGTAAPAVLAGPLAASIIAGSLSGFWWWSR